MRPENENGPATRGWQGRFIFFWKGLRAFEVYRAGLAATVLFKVIGNLLVLIQRVHASGLYSGDMDESVIAATFRCDETIAFVGVEEFYGAYGHILFLNSIHNPDLPRLAHRERQASERRKLGRKAPKAVDLRLYAHVYIMEWLGKSNAAGGDPICGGGGRKAPVFAIPVRNSRERPEP